MASSTPSCWAESGRASPAAEDAGALTCSPRSTMRAPRRERHHDHLRDRRGHRGPLRLGPPACGARRARDGAGALGDGHPRSAAGSRRPRRSHRHLHRVAVRRERRARRHRCDGVGREAAGGARGREPDPAARDDHAVGRLPHGAHQRQRRRRGVAAWAPFPASICPVPIADCSDARYQTTTARRIAARARSVNSSASALGSA